MNEKITFYRKRQTRADDGTLSQVRDEVCTVYARMKALSGGLKGDPAGGREAYGDYRFYIHRRSDIVESDVLVWNGIDFKIHFIADQGSKDPYMYIDAQRGLGI